MKLHNYSSAEMKSYITSLFNFVMFWPNFVSNTLYKCVVLDYDVLVTNPPYSGEHKVNLLKFLATHTAKASVKKGSAGGNSSSTDCEAVVNDSSSSSVNNVKNSKSTPTTPNTSTTLPFALLLPVYTATKSYWKDFAQAQALVGKNAFYILPPDYYEYSHPEGTGKDIPPFYSAWFLGGFTNEQKNRCVTL